MRSIASSSRRPWHIGRCGMVVIVTILMGCGSSRGKVSGRVLLNKVPLPGGFVTFRPEDPKQNSVIAELDEEGRYEAVLPVGQVKVSIDNRQLELREQREPRLPPGLPMTPELQEKLGQGKGSPPPSKTSENTPKKHPGTYVQIPNKYLNSDKSGLEFTVLPGNQEHDIELAK